MDAGWVGDQVRQWQWLVGAWLVKFFLPVGSPWCSGLWCALDMGQKLSKLYGANSIPSRCRYTSDYCHEWTILFFFFIFKYEWVEYDKYATMVSFFLSTIHMVIDCWTKILYILSYYAVTAPNAKLVFIHLGIAKATSLDVDCIVVITDSLSSAKKALNPSHHSGQSESIAIAHLLQPFFNQNSSNKIKLWVCPSKARWHLHAIVVDDAKTTIVPSTPSH